MLVAFDEGMAERIRDQMGDDLSLSERKMFGGLAFMISGNMAVAASGQGGLLLRCDPAATEKLTPRTAGTSMRPER